LYHLHTLDIIKAITSVPQLFIDHDSVGAEDIWKSIHSNSNISGGLNSLIFASNGKENAKDKGHTTAASLFAIQKVVEVFDPVNGNKERVIRLRDMGEKLDWTGDWSASSSKWSPELKEHLQYNQTYREGSYTFYMSFDDYITYYNSTCIVKLHNSPKSQ